MSPLRFQHESSIDNEHSTNHFTRPYDDLVDNKEQEASSKVLIDSWRLTPSPREPSSWAFSTFVNHQPVYYTVTPGDFNTFNSHQAADLHFSEIGMNTPSPIPKSVHGLDSPRPPMHLHHQYPHMLHDHDIVHNPSKQQEHQQQFCLPQYHLQRQGSAFDVVDVHKHHATPVEMEMAPPSPHFGAHQMISRSFSLSHTPQREMYVCTGAHMYR